MDDTKEYIVKDAASYLDSRFKDVEVIAEGDDIGIYPENYDLCEKILPMIEELDEKARNFLPRYFQIPVSVIESWIDSRCWNLESIFFGRISFIYREGKGFVMSYTYLPPQYLAETPPNTAYFHDMFHIDVKFIQDCFLQRSIPVGLEFGTMF